MALRSISEAPNNECLPCAITTQCSADGSARRGATYHRHCAQSVETVPPYARRAL